MIEHKVDCPQCHTPLRSNKPIPAGMKVKCPRCGLLFNTAQGNGVGGPQALPAGVGAIQAAPFTPPGLAPIPPLPGAIRAAPPGAPPALPARQASPPPSTGKRLLLVLGGLAGLAAVAVLVVWLCFAGNKPPDSPGGEGANNEGTGNSDPWAGLGQSGKGAKPKKKGPPPPLITLPPEEQKKVEAAVKKGSDWLRKRQLGDGTWPGGHKLGLACLCALTLVEAGAAPADPAVQKTAAYVRDIAEKYQHSHDTYEISLAILFLDKLNDPDDRKLIQRLTLRLVAAQLPQGGWHYAAPRLSDAEAEDLFGILKELKTRTPEELLRDPKGGGMGLRGRFRGLAILQRAPQGQGLPFWRQGGDNSNTQFATLALLAARRHEIPLEPTLSLLAKRFRNSQNPNGSWDYAGGFNPVKEYPTMTCAGLLGLAVSFDVDKEHRAKGIRPTEDPAVQKALKHLAQTIGEPGRGKPQPAYLYYLWSLERVGVLYQLKTLEDRKWYEWGVEILHTYQRPDGSWMHGGLAAMETSDTCFAILFLQRANLAQDLTDKLEELNALPGPGAAAPPRKD
ncbi:MAG: hypothetical protein L0Z62_17305 [Gemmataceae bacterium]|nr:hypothetical protein [Gemmataceae bacterium]